MSSSSKAILYDLPHKGTNPHTCWSPNVWKTRLVLNYKKIPYTSSFIEHPKIESTLSALAIPPNPPPAANKPGPKQSPYTLPAMRLPDGTYAMDSANIVTALEEQCPEPSLHLDTGLHEQAQKILGMIAFPLLTVMYPIISRNVVLDHYVDWWVEKKEKMLGMSMQEYEASGADGKAWKAAEPGFAALKKFLKENKKDAGPFILGSQVCYGDFILAAMIECFRHIGEGTYERFVSYDQQFKELHEACGQWFVEDT